VLDEVEEGLLSPVDVVEEADERLFLRRLFEQLAKGPGDLLGRDCLHSFAEQRAKRGRSTRIGRERVELLHDLEHRPVGDPRSVRQAAAADHLGPDRGQQLCDQARLADACLADQRDELAATTCADPLPGSLQDRELARPADEQGLVAALW